VFAVISLGGAPGKPRRAWTVFLGGSILFMGLNVVGNLWFHFRVVGEPQRLIPELEMVLCLAGAEALRRLWSQPRPLARVLTVIVLLAATFTTRHYVRRAWELFPRSDYRQRVEYRVSEWLAAHMPDARTFVAGSVRFWWDTWHDLAQVGGGSEQGLLNPHTIEAQWEILLGPRPELAVAWLKALGADAVIVTGPRSQEVYHDFTSPNKFNGILPVLYDDGQGDVIYSVPRRYPSLARVVDRARIRSVEPVAQTNLALLEAYDAVIEQGPDSPAAATWSGPDTLWVHARVAPGQSVLVEETYDPAWHAYAEGKALTVYRDRGADFSVIDAPPGEHDIKFVFEMPLENRACRVLTCVSLAIAAGLLIYSRKTGRPAPL